VWSSTTGDSLGAGDIDVGGTADGVDQVAVSGSGADYTITVGPLTSSGTVTVSIPAGAGVDAWAQPTQASGVVTTHFVVPAPPRFGVVDPPTATAGQAYPPYDVPVAAGVPDPTVTVGALPTGMTLSAAGALSGTPGAATGGTYDLTFTATNIAGDDQASASLVVLQAAHITSPSHASFAVGDVGSFDVTATGYDVTGSPDPALSLEGDLPDGLTFVDNGDGTATVSGTPTGDAAGSWPVTVTADNGVVTPATPDGADTQTLTVQVDEPPAFTGTTTAQVIAGQDNAFVVHSAGAPTPALTVDSETVTGTSVTSSFHDNGDGTATYTVNPAGAGTITLVVAADNGVGPAVTQTYTFEAVEIPVITSPDLASFLVGAAGSFTVTTSGTPTASLSIEPAQLPDGLTFVDNGDGTATISGTPTADAAGDHTVELTATNDNGSGQQQLTIRIDAAPAFTTPTTDTFVVGEPGSFTIVASGTPTPALTVLDVVFDGVSPGSFSPPVVDSGSVTFGGAPQTTGTVTLSVRAGNRADAIQQDFVIRVVERPTITSADSAIFVVGSAGSFDVTTSGSPAPALSILSGTLPDGLTLTDHGDGTATIAGTPADGSGGDVDLTLAATTAGLDPVTQDFTLKVKQTPVFTTGDTATFRVGEHGSFTIAASGVPTPSFTLTGDLPDGLAFTDGGDGTATIEGTATAAGSSRVVISAFNDLTDPSMTLTITVQPARTTPTTSPTSASPTMGNSPTGGSLPSTGGPRASLGWVALTLLAAGGLLTWLTLRRARR
jgi:hypothetical protein